ncbi:MAG: aromatic ring-hydroxylating dioxygenase subunit alpha [Solirubrobacterales bacterium]|nr:aromatic ring-hydroxylating dioxygenase subunit alpha [Solirubrobacterales bacterium]
MPVAPLATQDLEAVLAEDFGAARTLPARAYASEEVLDWERTRVFEEGWVCAGRSDELAEPKSQVALRVGSGGIVLARGEDGVLRGFHNSCRHRGHELLADGECAKRSTIACPYHSWAYNLDGTLKTATRFSDVPGFDTADFPLIPVAVREWNGWIFINSSADAPELESWLGNLTDHLAPWGIDELTIEARHEYVVQANWKLIIENYLECYHCPTIHPELCSVSPPESAEALEPTGMWLGGPMELREEAETMSLGGERAGATLPGLDSRQARQVFYFAVFPNLLISPHPDYVMSHRLEPLSPRETRVECAWMFPRNGDFDTSIAEKFWDVTNGQDFGACEAVQRGIESRGFVPGPFDYRESGVHALQKVVAQAYLTGEFERPDAVDMTAV